MKVKRFSIIFFFYNQQFPVKCCSVCCNTTANFSPRTPANFTNRIIKIDIFIEYGISHFFQEIMVIFSISF